MYYFYIVNIQQASQGQITTKLDENGLIHYLEQFNQTQETTTSKITFKRKVNIDSDDDLGIDLQFVNVINLLNEIWFIVLNNSLIVT